jgi:hypothetical protein
MTRARSEKVHQNTTLAPTSRNKSSSQSVILCQSCCFSSSSAFCRIAISASRFSTVRSMLIFRPSFVCIVYSRFHHYPTNMPSSLETESVCKIMPEIWKTSCRILPLGRCFQFRPTRCETFFVRPFPIPKTISRGIKMDEP